jgi:hypothetical protein
LFGLFGTLVTASAIFFSLRFGRQAVAEATQAALDAVAAQKADVEHEVATVKQARSEVETLVAEIPRSNDEARTLLGDKQPVNARAIPPLCARSSRSPNRPSRSRARNGPPMNTAR